MRMAFSNLADMILVKEVHRKNFDAFFSASLALSFDGWGQGRERSKNRGRSKLTFTQHITC